MKTKKGGDRFKPFDLFYALENAAEFLENEQWQGYTLQEKEEQEAANREAAKRIRRMANNYAKRQGI